MQRRNYQRRNLYLTRVKLCKRNDAIKLLPQIIDVMKTGKTKYEVEQYVNRTIKRSKNL